MKTTLPFKLFYAVPYRKFTNLTQQVKGGLLVCILALCMAAFTKAEGLHEKNEASTKAYLTSQSITFPTLPGKTYGDADYAPGATASSGLTVTYTSSDANVATIFNGKIHFIGKGTVTITASQAGDATYAAAEPVSRSLTVSAKTLTITPDLVQKTYGTADPALTYKSTGLVTGDAITGSLTRAAGENAGTYGISPGTLTANSAKYNVTVLAGSFKIVPRIVFVIADAKTKVYGSSDPVFTVTLNGSLVQGDSFTGALTRMAGESAGAYRINQGTLALSSNYDLRYGGADLTITKKPIAITPVGQTKAVGAPDPAGYAYSITSGTLVAGETFTPAFGRAPGEAVGYYALNIGASTIKTAGGLSTISSYDITLVPATLVITNDPIAINYGGTKTYGTNVPIAPLTPASQNVNEPNYNGPYHFNTASAISTPKIVADAEGNLYAAAGLQIKKYFASGAPVLTISTPSTQDGINDIVVDKVGNIYFSTRDKLFKIAAGTTTSVQFGGTYAYITGIAVNSKGEVYATDFVNNTVLKFNSAGVYVGNIETFDAPLAITIDNNDDIYVGDSGVYGEIFRIPAAGGPKVSVVGGAQSPNSMTIDPSGYIYMSCNHNEISRFKAAGGYLETIYHGQGGTIFNVGVDGKGNVYLTNTANTGPFMLMHPVGGFYLNKFLPAGLNFDMTTGAISGTPTKASPLTEYQVTGYNNYESATTTFKLRVNSFTAGLAALTASTGSLAPEFDSDSLSYKLVLPYRATEFTLTPTLIDERGTLEMRVNDDGYVPIGNAVATPTVAFNGTPTPVDLKITAADGSTGGNGETTKVYRITATRGPSDDAKLSLIRLTPTAQLTGTSGAANYNYTLSVANDVTSATLQLTADEPAAVIKINGVIAGNGDVSKAIALTAASTLVNVLVTAPDGVATKTYALTIVRNGSSNAKLSLIKFDVGAALASITGPANYNYTTSVDASLNQVTLQLTAEEPGASIQVNGTAAGIGTASRVINLTGTSTTANILVTAPNGVATRTYAIAINRAGSSNAKLSLIKFDVTATLASTTGPANYNYTTTVDEALSQVTLQLTAEDANAIIQIDGTVAGTGTASKAIALNAVSTTANILVTAPNGVATRTYAITINRTGSSNAKLSWIRLNQASSLATVTGPANYNYNINMVTATAQTTLLLTAEEPAAKIFIDNVLAGTGNASKVISLPHASTTVNVSVTAPNGISVRTYQLSINKPASNSSDAGISILTVNNTRMQLTSQQTAPYDAVYAITIAANTSVGNLKLVANEPTAVIQPEGYSVTETGTFTESYEVTNSYPTTLGVKVTAPNGIVSKRYLLYISRPAANNANLQSFSVNVTNTVTSTSGTADNNYNINLASAPSSVSLNLVAAQAYAHITINGQSLSGQNVTKVISLTSNVTVVHVTVTSASMQVTKTYDFNIIKQTTSTFAVQPRNTNDIVRINDGSAPQPAVEVSVHQGLSPNGDGVNDKFTIDGIGAYPENVVKIINRSGEVIYQVKGYDNNNNAFDGHASNGTLQQAGTYFYSLEYKKGDETVRKTGYVVIKY